MSMNEDKIIKTTICCYIAVSIVASIFFFLSRHQFNELEFSQKNLSFYSTRSGVRFYTPENNSTQFWFDCGYLHEEQSISLCHLPEDNYRATVSGHYLEYMSWVIPEKSVPHSITLFDSKTGQEAYHLKWSDEAIQSQTQDEILAFCLFHALLIIPALLTVIPFAIRLIFT